MAEGVRGASDGNCIGMIEETMNGDGGGRGRGREGEGGRGREGERER